MTTSRSHHKTVCLLAAMACLSGCKSAGQRTHVAPKNPETQAEPNVEVQNVTYDLAYVRLTDGFWQVWLVDADGTDARQLTTDPADKRYPAWAADGQSILYRTTNLEPFRVDTRSGKVDHILPGAGRITQVVPLPNTNRVIFTRFRSNSLDNSDLWIGDLDGGDQVIITNDVGVQDTPTLSPDGMHIAFSSSHGFSTREIYVGDVDGKEFRRLTDNTTRDMLPAWSPHGRQIAFVSDAFNDNEIYLMDPDGKNIRRLTHSEGIDTHPTWSPDGKRIAFASTRSGVSQIWIMTADGSQPQQITTGPPAKEPAWRRDIH